MWDVKASPDFWRTAIPLKPKYTYEQFAFIIRSIREAICELAQKGEVEEAGWHDHVLEHAPFGDGHFFESIHSMMTYWSSITSVRASM